MQNIATDSEVIAKQLIEYLRKNKYGRATFLPLTNINRNRHFPQPAALKEKSMLGLANTLVQAAKWYEGLAEYLPGRVVMVDTTDNVTVLARKYRHSLRTVTLEDELLGAGGSITGGTFKNSSSLLGWRREIEELEEACGRALVQIEKIQNRPALKESLAQEKKAEPEQLEVEIQSLAIRENTIRMNISQLEDKKAEIVDLSNDLIRERGQLKEQVKETNQSRTALGEDTKGLESKNTQVNQEIEEKTTPLENARKEREVAAAALSAAQMETANLIQKQSFIKENINRVAGEIRKLEEEFKSLGTGTGNTRQAILGKQQEIECLKALIADGDTWMRELEAIIAERTVRRETMTKGRKAFFARREELTGRLVDLDKDALRIQAQQEELEEKLEYSTSHMWAEYETTYSTAPELKKEEYQFSSEVKKRIDELKSRIRGLGNINMNAIEDYKEVSERYEFLKNQCDDPTQAQAEPEKIIEELDTGMRRQFEEKLSQTRAEFDKVFKELFRDGRGTLELMEDEDILEAGIQTIVQPPGKKLQNMTQLPGGEKALIAIPLLFAIQNLKPSPFCLLDEIEAALGDSNVDRFAGHLHRLIKNTQFIVITRRRGIMVAAGRPYGITMQEKGISTLVSVNLIEDDLDK